jgi:hypothetical protein
MHTLFGPSKQSGNHHLGPRGPTLAAVASCGHGVLEHTLMIVHEHGQEHHNCIQMRVRMNGFGLATHRVRLEETARAACKEHTEV